MIGLKDLINSEKLNTFETRMPLTSFIQAEYVWKTEAKNFNDMDFRYNLDQSGSPSFFRPLALIVSNVIK